VDGIVEIRAHDTSNYERAEISTRLGRIFRIRFEFYQRKFLIKFLNNFLSQMTPFLFYSIGGYLVIVGKLDIGALVAVHRGVQGPAQPDQGADRLGSAATRRADQVHPGDRAVQRRRSCAGGNAAGHRCAGAADGRQHSRSRNLSLVDEAGDKILDGVSFEVGLDTHVAIVGQQGSRAAASSRSSSRDSCLLRAERWRWVASTSRALPKP
jgi:putative ABC transport system ATP-binding protein